MSSPNEPRHPHAGDGPGSANGSSGGAVPPWQRGAARVRQPESGDSADQGGRAGEGGRVGASAGADARINQFMGGGSATPPPARDSGSTPPRDSRPAPTRGEGPPRSERGEGQRSEAYASELPDLSGTAGARSGARQSPTERPSPEPPIRSAARGQVTSRSSGPVRASMQIRRFDPWTVLKVSLVLSVASFFVWMIAVALLYLILGGMGVWSKLNSNVGDLLTSASGTSGDLVSSGAIFGGATMIGLVNIVLLTAMATCGAFIYNLTTDLVGGIEVTLADRE